MGLGCVIWHRGGSVSADSRDSRVASRRRYYTVFSGATTGYSGGLGIQSETR